MKAPTHEQLAKKLGVSVQAVRQYPKEKRRLMLQGLWVDMMVGQFKTEEKDEK